MELIRWAGSQPVASCAIVRMHPALIPCPWIVLALFTTNLLFLLCPISIVARVPCLILFCKLLSTGSLSTAVVHALCKPTQRTGRAMKADPQTGLDGGPFRSLTRSLMLTKYKPDPTTPWEIMLGPMQAINMYSSPLNRLIGWKLNLWSKEA